MSDQFWLTKAQLKRIEPFFPRKPGIPRRRLPATYCKTLYRQRHKVENMFARLKDWRRISMRYDHCAHTFFSAICIAAIVIFWLGQCVLTLGTKASFGLPNRLPHPRRARRHVEVLDAVLR
jgi:transposase